MPVKRVTPREAAELLDGDYKYLDVRSVPEFEDGHPPGAYNIPLLHYLPGGGMQPNPSFVPAVETCFRKSDKLVIGCKSGGRSLRAAQMLADFGFQNVVDMRGGFSGEPGMAGWSGEGLPVERHASAGKSWNDLKP